MPLTLISPCPGFVYGSESSRTASTAARRQSDQRRPGRLDIDRVNRFERFEASILRLLLCFDLPCNPQALRPGRSGLDRLLALKSTFWLVT